MAFSRSELAPFWRLSCAGFLATAVAYGPARIGFGLFLPEFRSAFSLSTSHAGLISSLGFLGMLTGLVAAYALYLRYGPRQPIVLGLSIGTAGLTIAALANSAILLAIGIFLSMSSAGFCWAPFNDAVHRSVRAHRRPVALSIVSTGTSIGVALAGAGALALWIGGAEWRYSWAAFAASGAVATLVNCHALRNVAYAPARTEAVPWRVLFRASGRTLFVLALSFGLTTSVYISFAGDWVRRNGGLAGLSPEASPAIIFISFGILGLAGLAASRAKSATGLSGLLQVLCLVSTLSWILVATLPARWIAVVLSGGLQGMFVMVMSAVMAFWSERLFPEAAALSFTVALVIVGVGSVVGPVLAGLVITLAGTVTTFLIATSISMATLFLVRRADIREMPFPEEDHPSQG